MCKFSFENTNKGYSCSKVEFEYESHRSALRSGANQSRNFKTQITGPKYEWTNQSKCEGHFLCSSHITSAIPS